MTSLWVDLIPPELIATYLQRRGDDLSACRVAVGAQDFPVLQQIGHIMKGNGVTFGFPELSELGAALETAAVDLNLSAVTEIVSRFEKWLEAKNTH